MNDYTIGQLAKQTGLSRSTLIYYDKRGLLQPSARSHGNYRKYSEADKTRLERILCYRAAGLSLEDIKDLLEGSCDNQRLSLLTLQLGRLNAEIDALKQQQKVILDLLGHSQLQQTQPPLKKETWVQMLYSVGLSEAQTWQWHGDFERRDPEAHDMFLRSLDISSAEVKAIREKSQALAEHS